MKKFIFNIPYHPPLDWKILLDFFRMHQVIGVEEISETSYKRNFNINNSVGFLKVTNSEPNLILEVLLSDELSLPIVGHKIRRMFDLNLHSELLTTKFMQHELLKEIYIKYPALRISRGWDTFETIINTIVGQSISIAAARKLLAKLVIKCNVRMIQPISQEINYLFPRAETLFFTDLNNIGITKAKVAAIKEVSKKIINNEIDLDNFDKLKIDLLQIKGIGQWTVDYVMLRCSLDNDIFLNGDLILKRYVNNGLNIHDFDGIKSYLNIYLWQHHLTSRR